MCVCVCVCVELALPYLVHSVISANVSQFSTSPSQFVQITGNDQRNVCSFLEISKIVQTLSALPKMRKQLALNKENNKNQTLS